MKINFTLLGEKKIKKMLKARKYLLSLTEESSWDVVLDVFLCCVVVYIG